MDGSRAQISMNGACGKHQELNVHFKTNLDQSNFFEIFDLKQL